MQPSLKLSRENLNNIIALYGADVLKSKAFNKGFEQKHHGKTTVSDHSFRVAMACAAIGVSLKKIGFKYDLESSVRISLSHDLGILGRYDGKFHGVKHCCALQHPLDSAQVADQILPDMTEKELNGIRTHMWPLSLHRPRGREAWALATADKLTCITDLISRRSYKNFHYRCQK